MSTQKCQALSLVQTIEENVPTLKDNERAIVVATLKDILDEKGVEVEDSEIEKALDRYDNRDSAIVARFTNQLKKNTESRKMVSFYHKYSKRSYLSLQSISREDFILNTQGIFQIIEQHSGVLSVGYFLSIFVQSKEELFKKVAEEYREEGKHYDVRCICYFQNDSFKGEIEMMRLGNKYNTLGLSINPSKDEYSPLEISSLDEMFKELREYKLQFL